MNILEKEVAKQGLSLDACECMDTETFLKSWLPENYGNYVEQELKTPIDQMNWDDFTEDETKHPAHVFINCDPVIAVYLKDPVLWKKFQKQFPKKDIDPIFDDFADDYSSIGIRLRQLRQHHKLTQEEISKIGGVSRSYYSQIETDKKNPPISFLIALKKSLNIDINFLLCGNDEDDF